MTTQQVDEFNEMFAQISEAARQSGYASGVNAALEVVQHHVDLPTALRIAEAMLALVGGADEQPVESEETIAIRRRNDALGTGSRIPA